MNSSFDDRRTNDIVKTHLFIKSLNRFREGEDKKT